MIVLLQQDEEDFFHLYQQHLHLHLFNKNKSI